jgi:protein-tyrosine-phosphatase
VREYLRAKGFDVSAHQRRTLTREILEQSHLAIAMSTDHHAHIPGALWPRRAAFP